MDVYRTDEEQVEALRKWWLENGKSIIAGIVIGLSAIYGWRAWQDHLQTRAEAASSEYQQMLAAVRQGETDSASKYAKSILDDYHSTSYARFAELLLARIAVDDKDYASAEGHLRQVMAKASNDQIRHIARLRLARLLTAQDKFKEAEALLNISDKGKFLADYEELRGDIFIRQGMTEAAQNAYKQALANSNASEQDRSILQMKMDELGGK
ncbi:MAG: hypothetical protein A2W28_08940 [Gammaproteobacteria bacterium RBG_16_51_14]|nr:MAG: hypothetical protein A2W28_08940 [Gammaproteobacteria bacterium RBG_16_51_14]